MTKVEDIGDFIDTRSNEMTLASWVGVAAVRTRRIVAQGYPRHPFLKRAGGHGTSVIETIKAGIAETAASPTMIDSLARCRAQTPPPGSRPRGAGEWI